MSREELRRRLKDADPNLKIASGRHKMKVVPRVLTPREVEEWGLPETIPIFPSEQVIAIEALWFKKQLQDMAVEYLLDPGGDKEALVLKLIWIGALDENGVATGIPVAELQEKRKKKKRIPREPRTRDLVALKTVPYTVPLLGPKFDLGQIVMSSGVAEKVAEDAAFASFVTQSFKRHANGDWGDLGAEDKKENEFSLGKRLRLFSAYDKYPFPKIWIITEADRSSTMALFPEEY